MAHRGRLNFIKYFFPSWGIVVLLASLFYLQQKNALRIEVLGNQHTACEMTKNLLEDELRDLFAELNRLAADPLVLTSVAGATTGRESAIRQLEHSYLRLLESTQVYDQLRILDVKGDETVRVNYGNGQPYITPHAKLQPKGDRYYFTDSIKLAAGKVYVSPFDLNVENGKIELPFKPMIRIAKPIADESGQIRGILIINYLGQTLIDEIAQYARTAHATTTLLNANGYWLRGENKGDEWQFMFPKTRKSSFASRYPDVWKRMTANTENQFNENQLKANQFETSDGVFTWSPVFPLKISSLVSSSGSPFAKGRSAHMHDSDEYYWYVVNRIPASVWQTLQLNRVRPILLIVIFVTLGLIIGSHLLARAVTRREQAEQQLRDANRQLEEKIMERTAELRREIDVRHLAERQEKDARRELQNIFHASGDGLMVLNNDGCVTQANPAAQKFLNVSEQAIIGRKCCDVMGVDACGTADCPLTRLKAGDPLVNHETVRTREDGTLVTGLITAVPHLDGSGQMRGYIFNIKDVTAWKSVLEENRSLEGQLRQAQKMEAIGTLAGGIAHDFNNVLMAIIVNLDLVMESMPENSTNRELLGRVVNASERATDLVKQILTFSRKSEHQRHPISLVKIITDTVKFLRASLPATITIDTSLPANLPRLMADPTSVHQVLLNLCTNAAQAMKEGGTIQITCDAVDIDDSSAAASADLSPGAYQRLVVADTGTGMDDQTMQRIFDPFFTTKPKGEGTGLGLSVVHGIAKSHGGTIQVRSHPGEGTVFNVFLKESEISESAIDAPPDVEVVASGETIIYLDDEVQLVEAGKQYLEKVGYNVIAFTSGEAVLTYLKQNPGAADLLLSDCTMPQLSGVELAEIIARRAPELKVVLYSGFMTPRVEKRAKAAGVRRILYKPISGKQLARELQGVLHDETDRRGPIATA